MQPRIEELLAKKMVGHSLTMSLTNNRTFDLWSGFMPVRRHIANAIGSDLYSIQVYKTLHDPNNFSPNAEFIKWAAIEVTDYLNYDQGFKTLDLLGGLYAVFIHKGLPSDFKRTMDFIYKEWMPTSEYQLDDRPHFEILGTKYKNNHPDSEEEVWIPIKSK
ncbi:GyrI-like domain-containing protein [Zobellia sp.]|nr:GyrI-like domain-containing protein [Zobellia sp.]